jgi:hypothetical protein
VDNAYRLVAEKIGEFMLKVFGLVSSRPTIKPAFNQKAQEAR